MAIALGNNGECYDGLAGVGSSQIGGLQATTPGHHCQHGPINERDDNREVYGEWENSTNWMATQDHNEVNTYRVLRSHVRFTKPSNYKVKYNLIMNFCCVPNRLLCQCDQEDAGGATTQYEMAAGEQQKTKKTSNKNWVYWSKKHRLEVTLLWSRRKKKNWEITTFVDISIKIILSNEENIAAVQNKILFAEMLHSYSYILECHL